MFFVKFFFNNLFSFIFHFLFGNFSGLILSNFSLNLILHDSFYVIGHFHYILSISIVYFFLSTFYFYYPFLFQELYFNEIYSIFSFKILFFSSCLTFSPMHSLGILGFPRRVFYFSFFYFKCFWFSNLGFEGFLFWFLNQILVI